eukprot:321185-Alexandrium_andersonii.AAC.1
MRVVPEHARESGGSCGVDGVLLSSREVQRRAAMAVSRVRRGALGEQVVRDGRVAGRGARG